MLIRTKRFRGPFTLWMQSTSVVVIATFLSAFVMVAPGCSDDAPAVHELDTSVCAQGLSGETEASAAVREGTPIRGYAWKVAADGVDVGIKGEGGRELGALHMELDVEGGEPIGRTELRVGGEVVASQKLTARWMNGDRLAVRADNSAGQNASTTWVTLDSDYAVERLTVGAPAAGAPPYPAAVQVGLDGAWKTFDVVLAGNQTGEAVINRWVADNLSAFEGDEAWTLLIEAANDPAWLLQAEAQARMCRGAAAQEAEGTLRQGPSAIGSQHAALSAASGISCQRYAQSSCSKDDPISVYQRIERVLGVVGLVVGFVGALLLGAEIGIAIAIGAAGFFLLEKVVAPAVIEKYVGLRKGQVVKRLGQGGNLLIDGSGDRNEAFESFFGGDGGGGSGCSSPFLASGGSCSVSDAGKRAGKSTGDPHLDTFDGKKYDLQAAGEFVLARARAGSGFEVQTRHVPTGGSRCPGVTVNKAVAAQVGSARIAFYAGEQRPLRVEGKAVDVPGGTLALPGGGAVRLRSPREYVVSWPSGDAMRVAVSAHISVWVGLTESRRGQVEGLLGNYDGDPKNDISRADGTILETPVSWDTLIGAYADDWRVTAGRSLFDYDSGDDPSTFVIEGFPAAPAKIENLPADALAEAQAACADIENPLVQEDCILDVGCTGDASFVDATEGRDPESGLTQERPVFLDDWTQEGRISNNAWIVSEDGRSVTQTNNGSPTFFVSPDEHLDEVIRGRFFSDGGDDDYIGFVFGYRSPLAAAGDAEDDFEGWLLSWKGRDQGAASAGLTLARLDGVVDTGTAGPMWTQTSGPTHRVIATSHSQNLGWNSDIAYDFELVYSADRVIIRIDGSTVFDLSAAAAGVSAFQPGRFGFYNFSQPDVTYSNFSAAPAGAEPPLAPIPAAGLLHHLDAARGVVVSGDAVESWSSGTITLAAPTPEQRPTLIRNAINGAPAIRFDGDDDLLESLGNGALTDDMTLLLVVAPRGNEGDFAGIISGTELDRNDYDKGFAVDLGGKAAASCAAKYPDPLGAFNTLNVVTGLWGSSCGEDYLDRSLPFGEFYLLTVEAGRHLMTVRIDGAQVGEEDHGVRGNTISLAEVRVGARHFSNATQGFFDGDVAEILIYDRPLPILERDALEAALLSKHGLSVGSR